jgi:S-adenosylmethionine hydrolase
LVETEDYIFVGPDNGVLFPVLADHPPIRSVTIENPRYLLPKISDTFHGRDVFAPAAAHCSLGVPSGRFGPPTDSYRSMELPRPEVIDDGLQGQVIAVDVFGNLVSDISRPYLERYVGTTALTIQIGETTISKISSSYQEVPAGAPLAIMGSWDLLEIAINGGSAQSLLGADRGDAVVVRRARGG